MKYQLGRLRLLALKRTLSGRFGSENVFVIASSPRSGSTLLGQALSALPRTCFLFEPLNLDKVPQARAADFSWRTYRHPSEDWPQGKAFLEAVFRGEVINAWTSREMKFPQSGLANRMVVKFVRANRLLPWICHNFEILPPVLLIRHPCAVVASQLNYGWRGQRRPEAPTFLDRLPRFRAALAKTQCDEEFLAAVWALDQLPALLMPSPRPLLIVTYEELVTQSRNTLTHIFENWNLNVDIEPALLRLEKPSSVVSKSGIWGVEGWKHQLSAKQIKLILNTVKNFGITFYTQDPKPNLAILHGSGLGNDIYDRGCIG